MTTPNTLLAAARLAYPEINWSLNKQQEVWDAARRFKFDLTNPADAYALEDALMHDGWKFWWLQTQKRYVGSHRGGIRPYIYKKTRPELLLAAVETLEAMK